VLKNAFFIQNNIRIKFPTFFEHGSQAASSIKDDIFLEGLNGLSVSLEGPSPMAIATF
jgi:hypothetical protein